VTDPARLLVAVIRLDRDEPDAALEAALGDLEAGVGGFILFGGTCDVVRGLTAELRERAGRPLWFAADLERGAGQQFRGAATLPPPAALASHPQAERAVRAAARLTALESMDLGVNWVLAPVLDLDVEPRNPIVGTRSFGADPAVVSRLGRAWIEACQAAGAAACAKHFPGHGRTTGDSHMELPSVDASRERLEGDLGPFRAVSEVAAGMMAAHVAYPALGCEGPASRSPEVLRSLLREEMGFRGLVVTDALVMAGFGGGGETGAATEGWRAVRALRAGCDILLYPSDPALVARTVRQAAGNDRRLAGLVEEAAGRSQRILERFGRGAAAGRGGAAAGADGGDADAPDAGPDLPLFRPGAPELTRLASECVRPAGPGDPEAAAREVAAWTSAAAGRVRIAVVSDDEAPDDASTGRALAAELRRRGWSVRGPVEAAGTGGPEAGEGDGGPGAPGASSAPLLLVIRATPRAEKGRSGLSARARERVATLLAAGGPALPVALGHPRVLAGEELAGLCAWASEEVMERGAAAWIADRAQAAGAAGPA